MKRLTIVAMLLATMLIATSAQAAFVTSLTGNSRLTGSSLGSLVNFAVYENTGADWRTTLGVTTTTLDGLIDGDATHIFMYQITRDDSTKDINLNIGSYSLPTDLLSNAIWRGAGTLAGTVFDSGGAVVGDKAGLNTIGAAAVVGTPTTGVAAPTFTANGDAKAVTFSGSISGLHSFNFDGNLGVGDHSAVFFATTRVKVFDTQFGFQDANGDARGTASGLTPAGSGTSLIPVANPEPDSLALLSIGMLGGVLWRRRKRKQTDTAETPAV